MSGFLDWQGQCPYCAETITLYIDPANNASQYIEDCTVCCRPISIYVVLDNDKADYHIDSVQLRAENE